MPRYVRERAAGLFRHADDEGLPGAGGWLSSPSRSARSWLRPAKPGFTQSIDDIVQWARTPHERACAGARKVWIDLELADWVPPERQDAVKTVVERVAVVAFNDELRPLASHLMDLADEDEIGPGDAAADGRRLSGVRGAEAAR